LRSKPSRNLYKAGSKQRSGFLIVSPFNPGYWSDIFQGKFSRLSTNYTALYSRTLHGHCGEKLKSLKKNKMPVFN
jgi:hypothetical protein